jgi:hypothetical protein
LLSSRVIKSYIRLSYLFFKMAEAFRQEYREVADAHREEVAWGTEEERRMDRLEMEVEGCPLAEDRPLLPLLAAAVPCEAAVRYSLVEVHDHKKEVVDPSEVEQSMPVGLGAGLLLLLLPQAVE